MELAAAESDPVSAVKKMTQVGELLTSSLNDLRNTLSGTSVAWEQTSLLKAIRHLKNDNINVDIIAQGATYELISAQTEAVFRLCQEAVTNAIKHGGAKNIHIVIRYNPEYIEVFAINDGAGCREIKKNYGLSGIENRIEELSGQVEFGSDGEKGFTIHAVLPRSQII
jgi:signal transduction histidine kinase